ncbi:hypothetical protein GXW82_33190 [Streptacidiphilus sp. 4-A2]|nr:hypothetical protein [Streptacidiphilus sp. 4-A2]
MHLMRHLYLCERLSTREIARRTGQTRHQTVQLLTREGVRLRPRGLGGRHPDHEDPALAETLTELYLRQEHTSAAIGELLGFSDRAVRALLAKYGIPRRGPGHKGRINRTQVPPDTLHALYVEAELPAADVANILLTSRGTVLRNAHEIGLPVRIGGPPPAQGPSEIELIDALYADAVVDQVLLQHAVPRVPAATGRLRERFHSPVPLTPGLLTDLYQGAGLAIAHIELLTGQPTPTVLRRLHAAGIPTPSGRPLPIHAALENECPGGALPIRLRGSGRKRADQRPGK